MHNSIFLPLIVYSALVVSVHSRKENSHQCSVCRAIILEAEEMIQNVDPKKTIQTGSFRVDPEGNQKITDKQYARSNTHLEEVMDSVCNKMSQYADRLLEDGTKQVVRIKGYSDEYNDDLKFDESKGRAMKYKCEHFLEDFDEDVISYLQKETISDYEKYICMEKIEVCSGQELEVKLETFAKPKVRNEVDIEGEEGDGEDNEEEGGEEDDEEEEGDLDDEEEDATEEHGKDEL